MENFCECGIYYDDFKLIIKHFMANYGKLIKIKGKDIKTKNKYDNFENLYNSLNQIIKSLPKKGNDCISFMKKCKNDHKDDINEITSKLENIDVLSERIENYHEKIFKEIPEEFEDNSDEDEENNKNKIIINKKENNEDDDDEDSDEIYQKIDVKKTMREDKKNIIIIKNIIENAEIQAKKEEEKKELIKMKNILSDALNNIEVELNRNNEQIDDIEENIDKGLDHVIDGDDELEKAAKSAVKRRQLAYQGGLALAFTAAGTIVPGIGNVVGFALGNIIGYGLHRYDKYRLDQALEKRKMMKKKK